MWRTKVPMLVQEYERQHQKRPTQTEISQAVNLRQPTVSTWMQWDATFKRLDADVVRKLAKFFSVNPTDVYEWVNEQPGEVETPGQMVALQLSA